MNIHEKTGALVSRAGTHRRRGWSVRERDTNRERVSVVSSLCRCRQLGVETYTVSRDRGKLGKTARCGFSIIVTTVIIILIVCVSSVSLLFKDICPQAISN
jgi:hypothetical protein